ncbi:Dehydrodolichyl diphosphate synthase 6 [Hondaea fermentalgiana]|uniref:Alkyl transferase n=1 Tax=Hondaea fermentalgiana TaxID=2315210 RepID=A0A2R5GSQ6_9STRA|nr:Dehydrodolichyl diphosphate synthase 6 [Hondaea fermentalgiana]|eukprot:GBG33907.1 Dehydrodolichyl diphosphate synthase 6 [Hondaea fermentalgiana]
MSAARGGRPELPALERLALAVAAQCMTVPRHVAFIMDGNRRFAKQRGQRGSQGHIFGYTTLLRVLEWCMKLGVTEVTVYAFSIDNFKRSEEEVATLMNLAKEKFAEFLKHTELVMQNEIRVNVLGDLSLLPSDLREAAEHVMKRTRQHKRLIFNICFAYTSSEEIARTVREIVRDARAGKLDKESISRDLISSRMYTRGSNPQLVIRTSGETRLSDFLVWQAAYAHLHFINVTWPELNVWHILWAFWDYHVYGNRARISLSQS